MTHQQLRDACRGLRGRFFYDAERGDIAFVAADCDAKQCDCEVKKNADGDQDCSYSLGDWWGEDHICEPIVGMLNAFPALLDENEKLRAALREALGAWTNMLVEAKGSSQHVDIEHDLSRIDELAELLPVIEISPIAKEHLDER